MGETSIEWADYTHNPWIGCEKVSAGCRSCYASVDTYARVSASRGLPLWGPGSSRHRTSEANWRKPRAWNRKFKGYRETESCDDEPYRRPRVFCASLADVFEGRADLDPWRADLWRLIEECTDLDWLLLTKRPENVPRMVPVGWTEYGAHGGRWPSHVWLGTSVEDQEQADARIPHLLAVPAPVRFLSLEPLLGPVDLRDHLFAMFADTWKPAPPPLQWLIIGGESGPKARPCDVAWIRELVHQGRRAGVATFVKQLGAQACETSPDPEKHGWLLLHDRKGGDMAEWPEDLRVRQVPEARR